MTGLLLSTSEYCILRAFRHLQWYLVLVFLLVFIPALLILWYRLTTVDPNETMVPTLYEPTRLQEVIQIFAGAADPNTCVNKKRSGETRHRTETLCRMLLERMLGMDLPKVRPKFLKNPTTNRCLELDMYNEANRIAFEYDGAQHDVYTPHFHTNYHHFEYRKLLDRLKTDLCAEHGIKLIRINWETVKVSDPIVTAQYLEQLLREHGVPFTSQLLYDAKRVSGGGHAKKSSRSTASESANQCKGR